MVESLRTVVVGHALPKVLALWLAAEKSLENLADDSSIDGVLNEESFQRVFTAAPIGMVVFDRQSYRLRAVNPAVCQMLGYTVEGLMGLTLLDILSDPMPMEDQTSPGWQGDWAFHSKLMIGEPLERACRSRQGQMVWVRLCLTDLRATGDLAPMALATFEDITLRKRAELALAVRETRYRNLVSNLPGAVYRMSPKDTHTNTLDGVENWEVEFISDGILDILGFPAAAFTTGKDRCYYRVIHPEDAPRVWLAIANAVAQQVPFRLEYRCLSKDGQLRWVLDQGQGLGDSQQRCKYIDGVLLDITDLKATEAQLAYRTSHDVLTGLPNRALFFKHLDRALQPGPGDESYSLAVLILDVDNFKQVNDCMGHSAGDQLLVEIATRLRTCLRPDDFIARLGGDEFVVQLNGIAGLMDVTQVADRIRRTMQNPFEMGELSITVSVSIGITLQGKGSMVIYHQAHDMLRDAEIAMYRAKQQGRSQFALYDTSMHQRAMERLELETALREACCQGDFVVYYQPIIDLATDVLAGFEALVRWQHPVRGIIAPDRFIPIAEEMGLILTIDELVLSLACQQMMQWQNRWPSLPPLFLSVNLSTQHFTSPDLVERVTEVLGATGLNPHQLKLEITESALMENSELTHHTLHALNRLGVCISLDDFGTGYSSLSYIHQFPMHTLKIDRSFVTNLHQRPESGQIVGAIVAMAKSLNLDVVAEGIETAHHVDYLKQLHCQFGQGYWFARPLESDAAEQLLNPRLEPVLECSN
jgi:diguanylate cyclase (GGDEF)-like protein/PAS domain S-box-containing protein